MVAPADDMAGAEDQDWAAFAGLDRTVDHWDRPGWYPGRSAYYWYLSFRDHPGVRALAGRCGSAVADPHFDAVPAQDLHMTIERVGFTDAITPDDVHNVVECARASLRGFGAFDIRIGPLAGSAGALSFSAAPRERLSQLRSNLISAMRCAGGATDFPVSGKFRPHVGIGYCNRPVDARPIIEQVRQLRSLPPVDVHIREVVPVELTRHHRSYSWTVAHRLDLQS